MTRPTLVVIGIGDDGRTGLSSEARRHLEAAQVLAGGKRHLDFFPEFAGERIVLDANLGQRVAQIKDSYLRHKTVVLASGDPLFYGIGKTLLESIPRDDLLFLPHVSSVQLAFARIKESWDDARIVSLHGRPMELLLPALQRREPKIAVFTDARNHPGAIARCLIEHGSADAYRLWVCENLGGPSERIISGLPRELADATFAPLNLVVLVRQESQAALTVPALGIPESAFEHRGLITRREIRLVSLCYLELEAGDVLWDIGAGSGSVAIEAARVVPELQAFAVEKAAESIGHIQQNIRRFATHGVQEVHGEAPEALAGLPDPDAVFIGGSGGKLMDILRVLATRLRAGGRIVINCVTLETLARGWEGLSELGFTPAATSVQLAHSRPLGSLHCLEADHTLFILRASKP